MKDIFLVSPVKTPDNIREFCKKTNCREFYVYHHRFINDNFEYIEEYIKAAHECSAQIYVNFKHSIDEEEVSKKMGIAISSGDFICFISSDNILPSDFIKEKYFSSLRRDFWKLSSLSEVVFSLPYKGIFVRFFILP